MRRLDPSRQEALHDVAATRAIERVLAERLAPHALMARAGAAVARLAVALHPHARRVWVACGPGNNGGDGLIAAIHLRDWLRVRGGELVVTRDAHSQRLPNDAAWARDQAIAQGIRFASKPPNDPDLIVDALLGLGARALATGPLGERLAALRAHTAPVLAVDLPSGLNADTGLDALATPPSGPRHTLSLLTLKPGLLTAQGRDAAGSVWLDDLGASDIANSATAMWGGFGSQTDAKATGPHATHKGRYGDVGVIGGQLPGDSGVAMAGAAVLAATAALQAGAGRVLVALAGNGPTPAYDPTQAALMFRSPARLLQTPADPTRALVAGCGGGDDIRPWLPHCLGAAGPLVLDADGLNAVAGDPPLRSLLSLRSARGWATVLTPHPLEAARLLGCTTTDVMADRIGQANALARRFGAVVVLKGSGTVVVAPDELPWINATGNARLATAGTGDVLAGMVAAALARGDRSAFRAACAAVAHHGALADAWPTDQALTADALARAVLPF